MLNNWIEFEETINSSKKTIDYSIFKKRIEKMSSMIGPEAKRLLDLGAGDMLLFDYLPLGIEYFPVDYKKRTERTVVCDFNRYEYPDIMADVVFISGCLEYIYDYQWFIEEICKRNPIEIIISYCVSDVSDVSMCRYHVQHKDFECKFANSLSYRELVSLFAQNGYMIVQQEYVENRHHQPLMKFKKANNVNIENFYLCNECGLCEKTCDRKALKIRNCGGISMKPYIDRNKCVNCMECVTNCPVMISIQKKKNEEEFSPYGIAFDITSYSKNYMLNIILMAFLQIGGIVYAGVIDKNNLAYYQRIDKCVELKTIEFNYDIRKDVFKLMDFIYEDIRKKKKILLYATPCDVDTVLSKINYSDLYCISDICEGCLSKFVYKIFKKNMFNEQSLLKELCSSHILQNNYCEVCIHDTFEKASDLYFIESEQELMVAVNSKKGEQLKAFITEQETKILKKIRTINRFKLHNPAKTKYENLLKENPMDKILYLFQNDYIGVIGNITNINGISSFDEYRFENNNRLLKIWVAIKQRGFSLTNYLESLGYKKIVIYGMGTNGILLVEELKHSKTIQIPYLMDSRLDTYKNIPIYKKIIPNEDVDAVIVTAINAYEDIADNLNTDEAITTLNLCELLENVYIEGILKNYKS